MAVHGVIYALIDPVSEQVRYIGQTTYDVPSKRLAAHLAPSMLRKHSYLARWLKGIVDRGMRPEMVLIDVAYDQAELDRLEIEYIASYKANGNRLVNLSEGGGGPWGVPKSPETREKIRQAQLGVPKPKWTPERRAHMIEIMAGRRTNTLEHMDMLHALRVGAKHTEATKTRISEVKKGTPSTFKGKAHTAEAKAANAAAHVGKMTGEKHAQWDDSIDTERDIIARLKTGMTATDVAAAIGKSRTFVQRRLAGIDLASHGVVLKRGSRKGADQSHFKRRTGADHHAHRTEITTEEIEKLKTEGLSPLAIAKKLGCSETLVRGRLGLSTGRSVKG
jgi:hypothetical protein